jgi:hypothetical protein
MRWAAMLEMLPIRNRISVLQSVAPLQKALKLPYPSKSLRMSEQAREGGL